MVRSRVDAGFTLLEVILVMILLGLGAALVPPNLRPWEPEPRDSVPDSVVALMGSTRSMAIDDGRSMTLVLGPTARLWWRFRGHESIDRGRWTGDGASILAADERIELVFTPAGNVWVSGPIRFARGRDTTRLEVNRLTGTARVR